MTHFVKQEDPATAEREPTLEGLCGLKNILHVMRHFNLEVAEYEPGLWSLQQAKSSVAWQSENDDQNASYPWRSGAVKASTFAGSEFPKYPSVGSESFWQTECLGRVGAMVFGASLSILVVFSVSKPGHMTAAKSF